MAGALLALLAGLALRRGREKQTHRAQDRQDQLLGQQRDTALTTALPGFYKQAQAMPEEAQTRFLSGIRSLISKANQGAVYVPGETGESGPSERVNFNTQFPVAQSEDPNAPFTVGADGLATRSAPIFRAPETVPQSVQMGAHGARNPFLKPAVAALDPRDALALLNEIRASRGDSQKALIALYRANFPGLNLDVDSNVLGNLDASPEDQARLANVDQTKAQTAKTLLDTDNARKLAPLEFDGLFKDNKIKNQNIIGAELDNKLKLPKFNEDVRHNKENERLTGRGINAGLFNGTANRGVQMFNIKTDAAQAAANLAQQNEEFNRTLTYKKQQDALKLRTPTFTPAAAAEARRTRGVLDELNGDVRDLDSGIANIEGLLKAGVDASGKPLVEDGEETGQRAILQNKLSRYQRLRTDTVKERDKQAGRLKQLSPKATPKKTSFLDQPRDGAGRFTLPAPQPQRVVFTSGNNNA